MARQHLVALSIGPVQGFIAAARRTRDLWFGSYVLSEVSKAVARDWQDRGVQLIFPAPLSSESLQPDSSLSVGNKLLARAQTERPSELLDSGKQVARQRWRELADAVRWKVPVDRLRDDLWHFQVDDVLELFGAWVAFDDDSAGYSRARSRLERLLGARKSTRDFTPAALAFDESPACGQPKSSLDGARESVLNVDFPDRLRRRFGLGSGEHLDCPGLVKRLGGDPEQFPPVTRVAIETWLRGIPANDPVLASARDAFEGLVGEALVTRVRSGRYGPLPYDGGLLFQSRIEAVMETLEPEESTARGLLDTLQRARDKLYQSHGPPTPYFAVLAADGDGMGAFIDAQDSFSQHIAITRAMAEFAAAARRHVEDHQGACIYAGGDDVLAIVPLHTALDCAGALRATFEQYARPLATDRVGPPTLSVGLGVGHVLTPLGQSLELARRAERLAKNGEGGELERNALAVIVGVRSGAAMSARGRWDSGFSSSLAAWVSHFTADELSDKTPYDLRQAAARVEWARGRADFVELCVAQAELVLSQKRSGDGARNLSESLKRLVHERVAAVGLEKLVWEMLVARWLAGREAQA